MLLDTVLGHAALEADQLDREARAQAAMVAVQCRILAERLSDGEVLPLDDLRRATSNVATELRALLSMAEAQAGRRAVA